jgi:uncharacterized membrane protein
MIYKLRLTIYILGIIFSSMTLLTWALKGGKPSAIRFLLQTISLIYFTYLSVNIVLGE